MNDRRDNHERKRSPPPRSFDLHREIATAVLAVGWAALLWRIIYPTTWPWIVTAMKVVGPWSTAGGGGRLEALLVVLYWAGLGCFWWLPLRNTIRAIRSEDPQSAPNFQRAAEIAFRYPRTFFFLLDRSLSGKQSEVSMRHALIGFALLAMAIAPTVSAQPRSYSFDTGTLVATAELPIVTATPLYFAVTGATVASGDESLAAPGNGIFYVVSGQARLAFPDSLRTVRSGEGTYIRGGNRFTLRFEGNEPVTYLYFLLLPSKAADAANLAFMGREIYRSHAPIAGLKEGDYLLSLSRVRLPAFAPSDLPHHRSGAALHYVISGFGTETANGVTIAKGPGSISHEPEALVYQWGNPGYQPLTYLVFNLNPRDQTPIISVASADQ